MRLGNESPMGRPVRKLVTLDHDHLVVVLGQDSRGHETGRPRTEYHRSTLSGIWHHSYITC